MGKNKITISGRDIGLRFSVSAMNKIADICDGEISNISEKLNSMNDMQSLNFFCEIICALANGEVVKQNCDISLGLETGKPKPLYDVEFFKANMEITEANTYTSAIFETMGMGSEFVAPDNVKLEEKDIDLAEIEAEKNEGNS